MLKRLIEWLTEPIPVTPEVRAAERCERDGHVVSDEDRRAGSLAGAATGEPIQVCCQRCHEYIDLGDYIHDLFDRQAYRQWEARQKRLGRPASQPYHVWKRSL